MSQGLEPSKAGRTVAMAGRLVYLVGPSGAGKDMILRHLEQSLPLDARVIIARRYVTRPADTSGERHIPLSRAAFDDLRRASAFCLSWESHGLGYGIGCDVLASLAAGLMVVVNGSREHLPVVRRDFGDRLTTVLITASADVLAERLRRRNRETDTEIAERLDRAARFERDFAPDITIRNDGDIRKAVDQLTEAIAECKRQCA